MSVLQRFTVTLWVLVDGWFPVICAGFVREGYSVSRCRPTTEGPPPDKDTRAWTAMMMFVVTAEGDGDCTPVEVMCALDRIIKAHRITIAGAVVTSANGYSFIPGRAWTNEEISP